MKKKERNELLVKVNEFLRNGINSGDKKMITEAYRWFQDVLMDAGICVIEDVMPQFPATKNQC